MKKKLLLAAISAMSVLTLAACTQKTNTDIATMKGGKITVADFYDQAKNESANQTIVQTMIITKVFNEAYGDKVTEKMIDKEYNKVANQFGDSFEQQLKAANYTKKSFREQIKGQLAVQEGLKANIKLTDDDLKAAWDSYHPEVEAQIIQVASEDDAKSVKEEASKDGADFSKIAKEKSTDTTTKEDGGTVKFDSTSTTIPAEVQSAAFALKDGAISDPISVTNTSTYATSYYVVKMVKNQDKGNDMDKYEKKIKEVAQATKLSDSATTAKIIGKELKDANVKIKDDSFSNVLANYITAAETKDSATDSSAKTSSTEETKTTESSSAE